MVHRPALLNNCLRKKHRGAEHSRGSSFCLTALPERGHYLSWFCKDLEKSVLCDRVLPSYCTGMLHELHHMDVWAVSRPACPLWWLVLEMLESVLALYPGFCSFLYKADTASCWVPFGTQDTRPHVSNLLPSNKAKSFVSLIRETQRTLPFLFLLWSAYSSWHRYTKVL